ncbi:MAG: bifunctional UDP-N-acetylglucosamine diphosphorylase/glucosamine-1-phosphate N-acetyltransferase GlmU [Gammaproteobacteria bacterium]|nr:bifunctional UDP-N-acetylglucosamine diphosphorylase/glucosamine-1-phosphate N-acetyltransferase GlmU [Gammaproteobacteria bacterium]
MAVSTIILAAGQGTRMHSDLPKVLQPLAGRPLLAHVIELAEGVGGDAVYVVYGHGGEQVREALADHDVRWVPQAEQFGTGHAVMQAMPDIPDEHLVLVLYGDVPLVSRLTLGALLKAAGDDVLAVLTTEHGDPTGYGRIVRGEDASVRRIVEEKDASPEVAAIREINTGLLASPAARLRKWLDALDKDNTQREYYLTDIVALAVADGCTVNAVRTPASDEVLGVNDKLQLAEVESAYRARKARELMQAGVTLSDPVRIDVRGTLACGRDVFIDINAVFEGDVTLGDRVRIGPNVLIRDSELGDDVEVRPCSLIDGAVVAAGCTIGPFARLRPGTQLAESARIGNFVEIKQSDIGACSKVNHLSYIGDTTIGRDVNVGAGTITCNYDGANKHRTEICDGAFIGSGVELIAPVMIGANATIGAGSTISKNTEAGKLTMARCRQATVPGWKRPTKK